MSAHYPVLAAALGDELFDHLLAAYLARGPGEARSSQEAGGRLVEFLDESSDYPRWFAEIAQLDRAHEQVARAPAAALLRRAELSDQRALQLVPASAVLQLQTTADEAWVALAQATPPVQPRARDWPCTVVMWRDPQGTIAVRAAGITEGAALRSVSRGTTIAQLATGLTGADPLGRAAHLVLSWLDAGLVAA